MNIDKLLKELTLEEKASLMSGQNFWNTKSIDRLNIPSIMLTDGPHGLRKQGGNADHLGLNASIASTCYPTAATLANSWDRELIYNVGKHLGIEAASEGVGVLLGPGLNIKRNPLCGRNFEYFSEDPYLSGVLASEMINGIQSQGVSACPKHFALNSQENRRMTIDEIVDLRTMHEIYLEGFRYCIENSSPKTIMTSYNKINGIYANENMYLLDEILYKKWNFKGVVVTDWGGSNDRIDGLVAGNQLEMPASGGFSDQEIVEAVNNGVISEELLDERVRNLLQLISDVHEKKNVSFDKEKHHEYASQAAANSVVLLRNENNTLPLSNEKVAIIGDFASTPRYQGAGSSLINPTKLDNSVDSLKNTNLNIVGYAQGFTRLKSSISSNLVREAVDLAKKCDVILLYLGLDEGSESEGIDRTHLSIRPNQISLVNELLVLNKKIVVILAGGAPVELPFVSDVDAILHGYLFGQAGASAISDILVGKVNPSGRLNETYPIKYEDIPSAKYYPGKEVNAQRREAIFVGYRYFDSINKPVLYPFGYGLSYTTFEYSNVKVTSEKVTLNVTNTGNVYGEEVVQVYVEAKNSKVFRAKKELKGFSKVKLNPNQTKEVEIEFDNHAFAFFNIEKNDWIVEKGSYDVHISKNVNESVIVETINVDGEIIADPYINYNIDSYRKIEVANITQEDYEQLLQTKIDLDEWDTSKPIELNDIVEQLKYSNWLGKLVYKIILFVHNFLFFINKPILANYIIFAMNTSFKQAYRYSNGKLNEEMMKAILDMFNIGLIKGLQNYIKASRAYKKTTSN